jgi:glycosyltransferase involved in cell wall biosynthesis
MGYTVDLISWTNDRFSPQKPYSAFIDVRYNMKRLASLLNKDCVKIQHIDTADILFHNAAEASRLLALQQRRGVTLSPCTWEKPNLGIEHADCATINGGAFAISTFRYANKPLYPIPVPSMLLSPSPERKDFEACRRNYLWLGSGGLVHKGLDLVLEAFAEMPEYHLTVCGPVPQQKQFERAYYRELYKTANIHTVGWVDITSPEFLEIANTCLGLIYPSSSEGQAGAVVTSMHVGLIPIISHESGVAVHDFGLILKDCSNQEIQSAIRTVSGLSAPRLRAMAMTAWQYARAHHTRERSAEEYRKAVETIFATHRKPTSLEG